MKVQTIETPKEFEPLTITITFESEEELQSLWHALNHSYREFINNIENRKNKSTDFLNKLKKDSVHNIVTDKLWAVIDNEMKIRNIEP